MCVCVCVCVSVSVQRTFEVMVAEKSMVTRSRGMTRSSWSISFSKSIDSIRSASSIICIPACRERERGEESVCVER